MKNKIKLLFVCIFMFGEIFASGGSVYTRYGIGDLYLFNSARKLSLGGIGTSLMNESVVNLNNPSTWSSLSSTKFGASLLANYSSISDANTNAKYSQVRFTGFHLALPIEKDYGIGFVIGIIPYSVINYDVQNNFNDIGTDSFKEDFIGAGGLSKAFFGFSYLLPLDISIGATFDYFTGNANYQTSRIYSSSSDYTDSQFSSEINYKGLGSTIGFLSPNLASLFNTEKIRNIRIGASYEISGKLNTDSANTATTPLGETVFGSFSYLTKIPNKLSLGLNFNFDKFMVNFDYINQPWSKFEQNGKFSSSLTDLNRYSLGVEYSEDIKKFGSFWELVKYRGGLSYEQTQYSINGVNINQMGIHAGISFPLGYENTIDIGLMYGVRGTTDNNLLKEKIVQASFSINLGELWFIRPER